MPIPTGLITYASKMRSRWLQGSWHLVAAWWSHRGLIAKAARLQWLPTLWGHALDCLNGRTLRVKRCPSEYLTLTLVRARLRGLDVDIPVVRLCLNWWRIWVLRRHWGNLL